MFPLFPKKAWNSWTLREQESIREAFLLNLKSEEYPDQHVVLTVLNHYPLFKKAGAKNVREKVINMIRKNKIK